MNKHREVKDRESNHLNQWSNVESVRTKLWSLEDLNTRYGQYVEWLRPHPTRVRVLAVTFPHVLLTKRSKTNTYVE